MNGDTRSLFQFRRWLWLTYWLVRTRLHRWTCPTCVGRGVMNGGSGDVRPEGQDGGGTCPGSRGLVGSLPPKGTGSALSQSAQAPANPQSNAARKRAMAGPNALTKMRQFAAAPGKGGGMTVNRAAARWLVERLRDV